MHSKKFKQHKKCTVKLSSSPLPGIHSPPKDIIFFLHLLLFIYLQDSPLFIYVDQLHYNDMLFH